MSHQGALHELLNPGVKEGAPAFIVYADVAGSRLNYVCRFIFNQVLRSGVKVTSDLNEWTASENYRINYSATPRSNSFQVLPSGLLSETGVPAAQPVPVVKNDLLYLYPNNDAVAFHFDVFSAVFYFISRCEEWQPYEKDKHGRFEAAASLLFKHGMHLKPVVDHWILEWKAALQRAWPGLVFPAAEFKVISTIDVDNLFAYRSKGLLRTIGGSVKDVLKLDLSNLARRLKVVAGRMPDPFDIYSQWSEFCAEQNIPLFFFFLFKTGTAYDRTVDPASKAFDEVLSVIKNKKAIAGLHPSYDSAFVPGLLREEADRFSERIGEPVRFSRQHFLRFDIRTTPLLLQQRGIAADFSMGFASSPGFRAGTSRPFHYYNFNDEKEEELLLVPFSAMDGAYVVYTDSSSNEIIHSLEYIAGEVKKTNGLFITVFHERTFSNHLYPGFGSLYKNLLLRVKDR